jgi:hypothetical protein
MKTGLSLTALAQEIERQANAKQDYVAPVAKIRPVIELDKGAPVVGLNLVDKGFFPIKPYAHGQLAEYTGIPKTYYDRMTNEAPDLLIENLNRWLSKLAQEKDAKRLVRVLDGQVRAVLSNKYQRIENIDVAEAVLPVLSEMNLIVVSSNITDTRLYIKAVDRRIEKDIPTGRAMGDGSHTFFDTVSPAISISNSEVGAGNAIVETGVYTKICTNLAMIGTCIKRRHVGKTLDVGEDMRALLSDATKEMSDKAFLMQLRDVARAGMAAAAFEANLAKLQGAIADKIDGDVIEVVEKVRRKFAFTETEGQSVLKHLISGGDLTRYGVHAAITRTAEDLPDYDRASEFERVGGQVIELPRADWKVLAAKAA